MVVETLSSAQVVELIQTLIALLYLLGQSNKITILDVFLLLPLLPADVLLQFPLFLQTQLSLCQLLPAQLLSAKLPAQLLSSRLPPAPQEPVPIDLFTHLLFYIFHLSSYDLIILHVVYYLNKKNHEEVFDLTFD